jgi:HmuY protein
MLASVWSASCWIGFSEGNRPQASDGPVMARHLRPKPNVYAIRMADGKYIKMRLVSYYCDGGQASGCFTIEYGYQGNGSRRFVETS